MGEKILIVDDEPNILRLISYALEREGFQIITAKNGTEGIAKARSEEPDLLILDIMLPDINGIAVCETLRTAPDPVQYPIIMLSAKGQTIDKITGFEAGTDEYMTKPFMPDELVARVKALLRRYATIRQGNQAKHGKVLGFIGSKGGVGTTSVVLNVTKTLLNQHKKVVAVELRPTYGTFSVQLNLDAGENISGLLDMTPKQINERAVTSHLINRISGLRILAGPQKIDECREIEPEQAEAIIDTLATMADYVVLDLPCSVSEANQAAVKRCDQIVLVVEPEPASIASAKVILKFLTIMGVSGPLVGLVIVNRAPLSLPIRIGEIETMLGCQILGVIPPASDAFMSAQNLGQPVVSSHSDSFVASALTEMAKKLVVEA